MQPLRSRFLTISLLLLGALSLGAAFVAAGEGQWLPEQVRSFDWQALREQGLELTPEEVWDGEGGGVLAAAVRINGCSASFVSEEGLILTNHHCGYRAINNLSTPDRNLLARGYMAPTREAELRASGYRVSIVRRIEDVTARVHDAAEAAGDDPAARYEAVQARVQELIAEGEQEPNTRVQVVPYFEGREWRRIYRTELRDVRLVFAPPAGVGEYGGEVDNWMWPRHTGDFSVFRAYVAPDGSPAEYSEENVPYRPEHWLEVSPDGVAEGDLVMIMGFPGRTNRYLSSAAVRSMQEYYYPARLRYCTNVIEIANATVEGWEEGMLKIKSRLKSWSNRKKNAEGMLWGLERNRLVEQKEKEEAEFRAWVEADPGRKEKYRTVLDDLVALDEADAARQEQDFVLGLLARESVLLRAGITVMRLAREKELVNEERTPGYRERDLPRLEEELRLVDEGLVHRTDAGVIAILLDEVKRLPEEQRLRGVEGWILDQKLPTENHFSVAWRSVGETPLQVKFFREKMLKMTYSELLAAQDPLLDLASVVEVALDQQRKERNRLEGERMRVGSLWIEAQEEWRGSRFYPDANSTLRVSVASVKGYVNQDGKEQFPFTTVAEMVGKHTGEEPFDCPIYVRRAVEGGRYGRWAPEGLGSPPVCFLSDGDTTGGNSGSPVVDGKGRLVGLNFDRVFENVVGDFGWNAERSRNISVDIRFILWILDQVWPAPHLLKEMGIEPSPRRGVGPLKAAPGSQGGNEESQGG